MGRLEFICSLFDALRAQFGTNCKILKTWKTLGFLEGAWELSNYLFGFNQTPSRMRPREIEVLAENQVFFEQFLHH